MNETPLRSQSKVVQVAKKEKQGEATSWVLQRSPDVNSKFVKERVTE